MADNKQRDKKRMKLKDLKPAEYNPRTITDEQLGRLKKALYEFGDLSGIIFNRRTGNVIGGHQRLKCLPEDAKIEKKDLKTPTKTGTVAHGFIIIEDEKYTYREVDWDDATEKMANIAANKHGGDWDDEKLSLILHELSEMPIFDLDLIGFETTEFDEILSRITKDGQIDDDEVPEVNTPEPITKTGDIYILGKHRLLCGDSTKKEDVETLYEEFLAHVYPFVDTVVLMAPNTIKIKTKYSIHWETEEFVHGSLTRRIMILQKSNK